MENLDDILKIALDELKNIQSIHELEMFQSKFLGKNGHITQKMQTIKNISQELRKEFGQSINKIKNTIENEIQSCKKNFLEKDLIAQMQGQKLDVTIEGRTKLSGSLHPITLSLNKIASIFKGLGFDIASGPEIESEYFNFEALNIPKNHPSRAMQDTFYTIGGNLLRTHTSPMQIRYAKNNSIPIKVIAPGRVYRVDMDRTHSPMFHQVEGLWIDDNINFLTLKGVVINFLRHFFENDDLQVRFRASYFPFTEPSAEVDIFFNDDWLEVLGCGMMHPEVLKNIDIDPDKYNGFAFGVGVDRLTMLKYGIDDLRLFFENDLDFLQQFKFGV